MDWWWDLLKAMDAHEGQAAWAQFAGATIALVVALGLGVAQLWIARQEARRRAAAYLNAAVAAAEHAEVSMDLVNAEFGNMRTVSKVQIEMSEALHALDAAERALASLPLHESPSPQTGRALVAALTQLRATSGSLRAFLASDHVRMEREFGGSINELLKAAVALRAEQRRLGA